MTEVGSVEATVTTRTYQIRFDSPEEFLVAETSSSPPGFLVDRLDRDVRAAVIEDLTSALTLYTDNDREIAFPSQTLTATATR